MKNKMRKKTPMRHRQVRISPCCAVLAPPAAAPQRTQPRRDRQLAKPSRLVPGSPLYVAPDARLPRRGRGLPRQHRVQRRTQVLARDRRAGAILCGPAGVKLPMVLQLQVLVKHLHDSKDGQAPPAARQRTPPLPAHPAPRLKIKLPGTPGCRPPGRPWPPPGWRQIGRGRCSR